MRGLLERTSYSSLLPAASAAPFRDAPRGRSSKASAETDEVEAHADPENNQRRSKQQSARDLRKPGRITLPDKEQVPGRGERQCDNPGRTEDPAKQNWPVCRAQ